MSEDYTMGEYWRDVSPILKQQEKYKNMLKRKNKEKKIYKDKNSSLRIEKINLIKCIERKDKEIERLNNIINELDNMFYETFRISQNGYYSISEWELKEFTDKIKELKGSDKE